MPVPMSFNKIKITEILIKFTGIVCFLIGMWLMTVGSIALLLLGCIFCLAGTLLTGSWT